MKVKRKIVALIFATLLLSTMVFACGEKTSVSTVITLLHTNDTHSRVYADSTSIDISQIATYRKGIKNSMLIDVGDTFHGLPFSLIDEGDGVVDVMNNAGYDLMTLGNHDFNFSLERVFELEKAADFKIISSNVGYSEQGLLFNSTYIQSIDKFRIGFFALTTYQTAESTKNKYPNLKFLDYETSARAAIEELEGRGVDAIVALCHVSRADTKALASKLKDDVDVIIDAHDHITTIEKVDGVLLTSTGQYRQNLGKVELNFDSNSKKLKSTSAVLIEKKQFENVGYDSQTLLSVNRIKAMEDIEYGRIVAKSSAVFPFEKEIAHESYDEPTQTVRFKETLIGNFVSDALREGTGSDIAFVNGGNFRSGINVGDISKKDIVSILPFNNYLEQRIVTVPQLIKILEQSVYKFCAGGFLQVSGLKYTANYSVADNKIANVEIKSITVGNQNIDLTDTTTTFTVAINSYIASGNDGYSVFTQTTLAAMYGMDFEFLIDQIQKKQNIIQSDASIEGRIILSEV